MAFSKQFHKALILILTASFAMPATAQNMDAIYNEVIGDLNGGPEVGTDGLQITDVRELRNRIMQRRGDFIDAALKRGHNGSILRESVGQENAAPDQNRRRFFTMQESFARSGSGDLARGVDPRNGRTAARARNDLSRLVETDDGERLMACRQGTVETRIIDPTENHASGQRSAIFVQLCAGEQFTDTEVCRLDTRNLNSYVRQYRTEIQRRVSGVTNWVAFTYTMSDPQGFEGCSTIEGLNALLRRSAISGEGRENFGGAMTAVRMSAIYRACTDFKRSTIQPQGSTIGDLHSDSEFVREARRVLPGARFILPQTNSDGVEISVPAADNLFGPGWKNGMEGSVHALAQLQRRIVGRANNGMGVCESRGAGGFGARGGGFGAQQGMRGGQFGDGMRGNSPGLRIGR